MHRSAVQPGPVSDLRRERELVSHALELNRPRFAAPVLRSVTALGFSIDNDLAAFRSELQLRLEHRFLLLLTFSGVSTFAGALIVAFLTSTDLFAVGFALVSVLIVSLVATLTFNPYALHHLVERRMRDRYPARRCWELMITRAGGVGTLPAAALYTSHPFAAPEVWEYLVERGFSARDREVADVILSDGTAFTLDQLVTAAISFR